MADEYPRDIFYCGVCGLPPEYCEWGPSFKKCKPWLAENNEELYAAIYGDREGEGGEEAGGAPAGAGAGAAGDGEVDEAAAAVARMAVMDEEAKEADGSGGGGGGGGGGAGGGGKGGKKGKKGQGSGGPKIVISRKDRNKRKHITIIAGLDVFPGVRLKYVKKQLGARFATGCSINNTASNTKELEIQGDVMDDVPALLNEWCSVPYEQMYFQEGTRTVRVPAP